MNGFNVLVIGTGMYTVGRGTDTCGTVMPGIFEWKRDNPGGEIFIAGTSPKSISIAQAKITELQQIMQIKPEIRYFPEGNHPNPDAYRDAIREIRKPACAIISTPDHLHREMAKATIEAGLHTLVVKPLAPTLEEVRELIELQEVHGVYCAVDFHKRYDYANLRLRDAISTGAIGELLYCVVLYSQRKSVPSIQFRKWVEKTTIFQYLGIHYIDIMYFATQAKPVRAMAIGQKSWLHAQGIDTFDSVQGTIEWEMSSGNRFSQHILTNWIDPESTSALSEQSIRIVGTKGRFESDQKNRGITTVTDERGIEAINPYFASPHRIGGRVIYHGYGIDSIKTFLNDVLQVQEGTARIEELEEQRATFKQSIVPTAVLEAISQSLHGNGEWVPVCAQCRRSDWKDCRSANQ